MGTNFYLANRPKQMDHMDTRYHIGKRSAAGMYCWDCEVSLCVGGKHNVHQGFDNWHKACPRCGKEPTKEKVTQSSAGRELGFNKNKPKKKKGVASCSSFTWAMDPVKAMLIAGKRGGFVDEYGRNYSIDELTKVLDECPIRFYDLIGKEFS